MSHTHRKKTFVVYGKVKDEEGKIELDYPNYFRQKAKEMFKKGQRIKFDISRLYPVRTTKQNNFYWGVVIQEVLLGLSENGDTDANDMPYNPTYPEHQQAVHDFLAMKFLGTQEQYVTVLGETHKKIVPKSTTELDTVDFEIYIESIRVWASNFLGIKIPYPNEAE